jgi:ubiquinone/menaquinone biosynthesis C-methylase UbiE
VLFLEGLCVTIGEVFEGFGNMERMNHEHLRSMPYSTLEHKHRYAVAADLAYGHVLDIACGIGYGAELVDRNNRVVEYIGVDNAEVAIEEAKGTYSAKNRSFELGTVTSLRFPEETFDTIISFETLEHIRDASDAVRELRRVLKRDGLLIGSVPDGAFDAYMSDLCGDNQFHCWRFSFDQLHNMLAQEFENVAIGYAALAAVSVIWPPGTLALPTQNSIVRGIDHQGPSHGSYYFLATNGPLPVMSADLALGIPFFRDYCEMQHRMQALHREIAELKNQVQEKSLELARINRSQRIRGD